MLRGSFTLILFGAVFIVSTSSAFCKAIDKVHFCQVIVKKIRSTQPGLGKYEAEQDHVKMKTKGLFKGKNQKKLRKYMQKKYVKFVRGPAGLIFVVDGNHRAYAYEKGGVDIILGEELADWQDVPRKEFWKRMYDEGYVYPFPNLKGKKKSFDELWNGHYFEMLEKTPVQNLADIPLRSIVGILFHEELISEPNPRRFYWQFDEARQLNDRIIPPDPDTVGDFDRALNEAREYYRNR